MGLGFRRGETASANGWLVQICQAAPEIARFLLSYGSAKGCVFAVPMALAAVLTPETYGAVEFSLTAGLSIATIMGFGVPQAIPRLLLVQGQTRSIDILAVTVLGVGFFALSAALATMLLGAKIQWWLASFCVALFSAQLALSVWAQTEGYRILSAWVDNGVILLVGFAAIPSAIGWAFEGRSTADELGYGMAAVTVGILLIAALLLRRFMLPGLFAAWRQAVGVGAPTIVGGLLVFAVTGTPRLLVGQFASMETLALYAFALRINLVLMLGHQILMTAFFKRIVQLSVADADRLFSAVSAALIVAGALLGLLWPLLRDWMPVRVPYQIFGLVTVQTILWAASAMLEVVVNREGCAGVAAWWAGLVAVSGIGGLYLTSHWMSFDLFQLCFVFIAMLVALVAGQLTILWWHSIKMRRFSAVIPSVILVIAPGLLA